MTIPIPRHDESEDDYRRRVRRTKWRNRLVTAGIVLVVIACLVVYAALTTKPMASVGEQCGPEAECIPGAWCLTGENDRGVCVASCEPNTKNACPSGMTCKLFSVIEKKGADRGAKTYACEPAPAK